MFEEMAAWAMHHWFLSYLAIGVVVAAVRIYLYHPEEDQLERDRYEGAVRSLQELIETLSSGQPSVEEVAASQERLQAHMHRMVALTGVRPPSRTEWPTAEYRKWIKDGCRPHTSAREIVACARGEHGGPGQFVTEGERVGPGTRPWGNDEAGVRIWEDEVTCLWRRLVRERLVADHFADLAEARAELDRLQRKGPREFRPPVPLYYAALIVLGWPWLVGGWLLQAVVGLVTWLFTIRVR